MNHAKGFARERGIWGVKEFFDDGKAGKIKMDNNFVEKIYSWNIADKRLLKFKDQ